ncbi:MAG: hypothetical protein FWD23_12235 [Oscillospiraceae bacterium]|nr:hypothetical protein [Oscillospiraceae bacterium]
MGMNKYNGEFKISNNAYYQLCRFCLRYKEFQDEIEKAEKSFGGNGLVTCSGPNGRHSDPTGNKAIRAIWLREKCELIERTAFRAAGEDYQALLKNVTTGVSYDQMMACGIVIKVGRNVFYEKIRRYFFWLLEKKV